MFVTTTRILNEIPGRSVTLPIRNAGILKACTAVLPASVTCCNHHVNIKN